VSNRWDEYVMASDASTLRPEEAWSAAVPPAGDLTTMYVLGVGFDPRSLVGLQRFLAADHRVAPVIGLVELPPPSQASGLSARALAADNQNAFENLADGYEVRRIEHEEVHSRANAGPRVARALTNPGFVHGISHLLIDVSSLPANLYFPMIAASLSAADRGLEGFPRELQVVACENPAIDAAIEKLGVSEAAIVGGFRGSLEHESDPTSTVIWAPVLGERAGPALQAIHNLLAPGDVCPVLPFPARNPRRGDELVLEHQVVLFDEFRVNPGSIIYADERNPFDLYRTLSRLQSDFGHALAELQASTVVLSTHTSKLLSLGVLLAAFEHELPIVAAPAIDYELADVDLVALGASNALTCVWLAGSPYS
jgi:hypothetical protein